MKVNRLLSSFVGIAAVIVLAGCGQSPQAEAGSASPSKSAPAVDLAKAEAEIRASDVQWLAAAKARDVARSASFWSDDAVLLFPGSPPVVGKKALLDYVAGSFKDPDFSITFATDTIVVASSGDMAYEIGKDTITYNDGRKRVTAINNGVVVWRKRPDGQWKAAVDIGTPAPAKKK
jgi:uncharacterized protein (TIGR02246 family)